MQLLKILSSKQRQIVTTCRTNLLGVEYVYYIRKMEHLKFNSIGIENDIIGAND